MVCSCKKAADDEEATVAYPQTEQPASDNDQSNQDEQDTTSSDEKEQASNDEQQTEDTQQPPEEDSTKADTKPDQPDTAVDSDEPETDVDQDDSQSSEELFNYEVTDEPFESIEIRMAFTSHKTYSSEKELFDAAEMVFIGMPLDTFTEGDMRYYDFENKEVDKNSDQQVVFRCTVRNIKVIEMLKGDTTLDTVEVADRAALDNINGSQAIVGLPSSDHIAKKNVKYIYYLIPALPDSMDFYFIAYDSGLINIDGLDSDVGRADRVLEAKERLPEQFKKYDRSAELTAK